MTDDRTDETTDLTTNLNTVWEIPEPLSTVAVSVDDETEIFLRRHGNPRGPRLVLSHGNGLAIDLYFPFWSLLIDDFDLIVYDLRNHGWNGVSTLHEHSVPTFVNDHDRVLEAIDRHFGEKPKIGIFHSVSALTTLLSPERGSGLAACILYDPPLCKHGASYEEFDAAAERVAAMTRRRASQFNTREEFAEVLPYLPTFQRVVPGVFELVARTTLRESTNGTGFVLRCPREYEAQIVDYAATFAVLVDFHSFCCPLKVIGADPTLPFSYLPTLDLSDIVTVDYDFLPETTHLLQMEQPEECVAAMHEFLESHSLV